jgi:hypothetical protein
MSDEQLSRTSMSPPSAVEYGRTRATLFDLLLNFEERIRESTIEDDPHSVIEWMIRYAFSGQESIERRSASDEHALLGSVSSSSLHIGYRFI